MLPLEICLSIGWNSLGDISYFIPVNSSNTPVQALLNYTDFAVWKERCISSWYEIPWNLNYVTFALICNGNKFEYVKICPEMVIPFFFFFDHCIANACHFSRNTWNICCIFLFLHIFFFKTKFFILNGCREEVKNISHPDDSKARKLENPTFIAY